MIALSLSLGVALSPHHDIMICVWCSTGGLFPTESHEYEVFRFALSHHQDIPKLVPQVDMVKMGNSFSMTYACEYQCLVVLVLLVCGLPSKQCA